MFNARGPAAQSRSSQSFLMTIFLADVWYLKIRSHFRPKPVNSRSPLSTDELSMNSVKIDNVEARSGERKTGYLLVGETAIAPVQMPVAIINGVEPGPTLCISGGVHGFEYSSIAAVMRIIRETDPATLKGASVAVPVVNMTGFEARGPQGGISTAFQCPIDGININRVMPGNPDGSMGYQIAAAFMSKVVSKADCLIDCHGGDLNEELVPFVVIAGQTKDRINSRGRYLLHLSPLNSPLNKKLPAEPMGPPLRSANLPSLSKQEDMGESWTTLLLS